MIPYEIMNFKEERNIRLNIFRIIADIIWINEYVHNYC